MGTLQLRIADFALRIADFGFRIFPIPDCTPAPAVGLNGQLTTDNGLLRNPKSAIRNPKSAILER
ncbi:MAG TPA: hypothetical protein VGQ81_10210 [Acidobacteriota bacterium]|nr:hypothetical protein [Acidobacteriota bacterium]